MVDPEVVAKNIDLLRHLHGGHKELACRLKGVASWNQVSEFALGKTLPSELILDQIESSLSLPQGWTRRDNIAALSLKSDQFELLMNILRLDSSVRVALCGLVLEIVNSKEDKG